MVEQAGLLLLAVVLNLKPDVQTPLARFRMRSIRLKRRSRSSIIYQRLQHLSFDKFLEMLTQPFLRILRLNSPFTRHADCR